MTKACTECLYIVPAKEDAFEPMDDAPEDCPKCGGVKTVQSVETDGDEDEE